MGGQIERRRAQGRRKQLVINDKYWLIILNEKNIRHKDESVQILYNWVYIFAPEKIIRQIIGHGKLTVYLGKETFGKRNLVNSENGKGKFRKLGIAKLVEREIGKVVFC